MEVYSASHLQLCITHYFSSTYHLFCLNIILNNNLVFVNLVNRISFSVSFPFGSCNNTNSLTGLIKSLFKTAEGSISFFKYLNQQSMK